MRILKTIAVCSLLLVIAFQTGCGGEGGSGQESASSPQKPPSSGESSDSSKSGQPNRADLAALEDENGDDLAPIKWNELQPRVASAIRALGTDDESYLEEYIELFASFPNYQIRSDAYETILRVGDEELVRATVLKGCQDKAPSIRSMALWDLGEYFGETEQAVEIWTRAIHDPDSDVRLTCASLLDDYFAGDSEEITAGLVELAADTDQDVRLLALEHLSARALNAEHALALKELYELEPDGVLMAIAACYPIPQELHEWLKSICIDEATDDEVVWQTGYLLGIADDGDAISELLLSDDSRIRVAGLWGSFAQGVSSEEFGEVLSSVLRDDDPAIVLQGINMMTHFHQQPSHEQLEAVVEFVEREELGFHDFEERPLPVGGESITALEFFWQLTSDRELAMKTVELVDSSIAEDPDNSETRMLRVIVLYDIAFADLSDQRDLEETLKRFRVAVGDLEHYESLVPDYNYSEKGHLRRVYYDAACAASLNDEHEEAVGYLRRSLELGWSDMDWILEDSDLEALQSRKDFKELIEEYR